MIFERKLFELLKDFAPMAGKLALPHYGKIDQETKMLQLEGKEYPSAVTWLDKSLQELLLARLIENGFSNVAFNGEEDTPLVHFFSQAVDQTICVHCDPIDGTKPFIRGDGKFAVGLGLSRPVENGLEFFATVVYDVLDDQLYWSFENEASHTANKNPPRIVYVYRTVSEEKRKELTNAGFTVEVSNMCAHLGIVTVGLGQASAYMYGSMQVHDALIPYSFAHRLGALAYGINGHWQNPFSLVVEKNRFDRIPKMNYYANSTIADEIESILK